MDQLFTELYRIFQPYRIGDDLFGCVDGVTPPELARIATSPLKSLTVEDLDRYAFKAMTTWGHEQHFKYFLPRLFELSFEDFLSFGFPEVLFGKLAYAKWTTWPRQEQVIVQEFLMRFWRRQLSLPGDFPEDCSIETTLAAIAETCDSLRTYLDVWLSIREEAAALHLGQLIHHYADEIMETGGISCFWNKSNTASGEIVAWLASNAVERYFNGSIETISSTFPLVNYHLEGIRSATNG